MSDLSILVVDDDRADRLAVKRHLGAGQSLPFDALIHEASDLPTAWKTIHDQRVDCVMLDCRVGAEDGLSLLRMLRRREERDLSKPGMPVIVLTGHGDENTAVRAMKEGATDYIPKCELSQHRLASAIRAAIDIHRARWETACAHSELQRVNAELEQRVAQRTLELERANASLQQRNVELDQFTSVASHDLQAPLRTLIAFAEMLPHDLGHDLPESARKNLEFMLGAARRMRSLVRDLLLLCRSGKSELSRERVALETCADQAIQALAVSIEESRAAITRDPLPEVFGDATLLTQIYQNLIDNALKFSNPGQAPQVRLTARRGNDRWILGVRDQGLGIALEHAQDLFHPFKRFHGHTAIEGTGIGLAICRKTVERHGGRIWVESAPGAGAHFQFDLPDRSIPSPPAEAAAPQSRSAMGVAAASCDAESLGRLPAPHADERGQPGPHPSSTCANKPRGAAP